MPEGHSDYAGPTSLIRGHLKFILVDVTNYFLGPEIYNKTILSTLITKT